ncbi:MAG TPA: hypothetical protein HPP97_00710 [Desulfuromonadales bacterium]|nr:hypothetical protein [Desulfuromonadales bacterium]
MNRQTIGAILALNLLAGCTTAQITPIRRGEPVALVFASNPRADGAIDISNEALGSNARVGAGTGATAGAVAGAVWGLSCGPFAVFCSPVLAAAGAVTGTIAGAGVGAGVGVTGALSNEKAAQLRDRLMRVQQSHSLPAELQKNVTDRAQKYWKLGTDPSAAVVTIELQNLLLRSTRDEQISCTVRVTVSVQQRGTQQAELPEKKVYEYVSSFNSLRVWLDESSDFVDTLFTGASQQIAAHIVSDLALN